MPQDIEKLKKRLGHVFANGDLLREALTHRSYAMENNLSYDNQRLEFLGDAVLEIILTEYLFFRYPDSAEGMLTQLRSGLERQETLAVLARHLSLGDYLITGKGELDAGGAERDSTLADLFEAVLGALYIDAGYAKVKALVLELVGTIYPEPKALLVSLNPKGWLQEYSQHRWCASPDYAVVALNGPAHRPTFEVEVRINALTARGLASNRKQAESRAAEALIRQLKELDPDLLKEE